MGWLDKLFGGGGKKEETMKMEPATMKGHPAEHAPMASMPMAKDPVCGMEVDEKTAAAKSEHMGKTYYFCSPGCKKAFDENPAKYTGGEGQEMAGHGSHQM